MGENKFLTNIRFPKQKGRHDKIRKRFASGNVNIVYVTCFLFYLIGGFCKKNIKDQNLVVSKESP